MKNRLKTVDLPFENGVPPGMFELIKHEKPFENGGPAI